ncbi:carbamoyltransferase HypF [Paraconexibacter antarcticus]|uniref:Carbamoyltransferase n=1 Tax=Paraconexibacter antarcticus TaxID=2949664 RepID=A0ABY5DRE6_9ACTN|nr:carbamoyltransferase HypF [Paraconexibacter antarcticus]UTI64030.1 carbamoyltransferase HypF [Paraconexibacter antarcticus]
MTVIPALHARRVEIRVEGVVQGVGFRPFVYRVAGELGLAGFVRNDTRGVLIEAEGDPEAIAELLVRLRHDPPPLARVEETAVSDRAPTGETGFAIVGSDGAGTPDALVSADTATCADCLAEVRDPDARRHRYPFTNCTNCGPRFTIVRDVPYDRSRTTMKAFPLCADCRREYEDPRDRRFHAQPIACPACGPRVRLLGAPVPAAGGADAIARAAALLRGGAIVAIKGLGGYHLACRADHQGVVAELRARKHREDRPFALMVVDVVAAQSLVLLAEEELALLRSAERPIVLGRRRTTAGVADAVAPGLRELGVMLPYTPLHQVLLDDLRLPLVLTSGNLSDEPIAYADRDALERLQPIADAFLVHDRPIHMRTDDSVVRVVAGRRTALRRSRGYVPESLRLPVAATPPVLAVGAQLKNTFCVARGGRAWVSHHVGDLDEARTRASFAAGVEHFERLFAVTPEVVAHDRHPDYASTAYALDRDGVRTVAVQHHHAHLAACLAEHGETGTAVGAIYDGSGHGEDGTVWGGEILVGDLTGFRRAGHLHPVRLPGGDHAARQPWRMAASWMIAAEHPHVPDELHAAIPHEQWDLVGQMVRRGFSAPVTTSMGRLFDAAAALCGLRARCSYEGQAAVELEARADVSHKGAYTLPVGDDLVLDARTAIRALLGDVESGVDVALISARLHRAIAEATATACERAAEGAGTDLVVLSGGVFQNRLLLTWTIAACEQLRLRVLVPSRLPANDGGISFGQAAVAAARGARA